MEQIAISFPVTINNVYYRTKEDFVKAITKDQLAHDRLTLEIMDCLPLFESAKACLDTAYDIMTEDNTTYSLNLSNIRYQLVGIITLAKDHLAQADHTNIVNRYL